MSSFKPTVWVAIPAMDEGDILPGLIGLLKEQTWGKIRVFICINQPESWWDHPEKRKVCLNNQRSLDDLRAEAGLDMTVLDRSSRGQGWPEKKAGVGWARRVLMDAISREADPRDLIVSLDADTRFRPGYLESVVENFRTHPGSVALSVPYYHEMTGDLQMDRAMLRYEIYMRYYALNLWMAESPYSFTAIGSAIVLPVKSYTAIGGITPYAGGEDFYLIQKLLKYGSLLVWNREKVYPATRYSDRVGFGTGPAIRKGSQGDWSAYPLFPGALFESLGKTIRLFPELYNKTIPTPMDDFLVEKFKTTDLWNPLRENSRSEKQFVRACHTRIDGLRTLQYMKWKHKGAKTEDEKNLRSWFERFDAAGYALLGSGPFSFEDGPVEMLDAVRNRLALLEANLQQSKRVLQL